MRRAKSSLSSTTRPSSTSSSCSHSPTRTLEASSPATGSRSEASSGFTVSSAWLYCTFAFTQPARGAAARLTRWITLASKLLAFVLRRPSTFVRMSLLMFRASYVRI